MWYCNFYMNIKPKIIYGNMKYANHIKKILELTGVDIKYVEFIKDSSFKINDLTLKLVKTNHTPKLDCFGIMFNDLEGKYYYTGDTNDINNIKKLCKNPNVKTIYTEVSPETYDVHIKYDDIVKIKSNKFVLMHFGTMELYKRAIKDGFIIANMLVERK